MPVGTPEVDGGTALARARAAYPGLADAADVAQRLAHALPPDASVDLVLVRAAAQRDEVALAALVAVLEKLRARLVRGGMRADVADDVLSVMRTRMFAAPDDTSLLARYDGRGKLSAWLHVVAVRLSIDDARKHARETQWEEDGPSGTADALAAVDLEADMMRRRYGASFKAAFAAAVAELSVDERNVLRWSVLHQLSIDDIGKIYGIHRATAARRIQAAKDALSEGTRKHLTLILGASDSEVSSILHLIRSSVDVSLRALDGDDAAFRELESA